jgi:hypothetical protein
MSSLLRSCVAHSWVLAQRCGGRLGMTWVSRIKRFKVGDDERLHFLRSRTKGSGRQFDNLDQQRLGCVGKDCRIIMGVIDGSWEEVGLGIPMSKDSCSQSVSQSVSQSTGWLQPLIIQPRECASPEGRKKGRSCQFGRSLWVTMTATRYDGRVCFSPKGFGYGGGGSLARSRIVE